MGDLHCPARFVVVGPATASSGSPALSAERIAAVCAAPDRASTAAGAELAERLGVEVARLTATPSESELDVLVDLADRYRGETVAVVTPGVRSPTEDTAPIVYEYDEQGWRRV